MRGDQQATIIIGFPPVHATLWIQANEAQAAGIDSMAHTLLTAHRSNEQRGLPQEWSLEDIKGAAGAVFIAGADTVSDESDTLNFQVRRCFGTNSEASFFEDTGDVRGVHPQHGAPSRNSGQNSEAPE